MQRMETDKLDDVCIVLNKVSKKFSTGVAIEALSFDVKREEIFVLVGQTGCGKSTVLNMIGGVFGPSAGEVLVDGSDPLRNFMAMRGKIGTIFQESLLLPWKKINANICSGMRWSGVDRKVWDERTAHWLEKLGLGGKGTSYPYQLSGGQRQRASMARAFAIEPSIILADEAFSALDAVTARRLRQEFVSLVKQNHKTAVVITHSIEEAVTIGDRIIVLARPGRIVDSVDLRGLKSSERLALKDRVVKALDANSGNGMVSGGRSLS